MARITWVYRFALLAVSLLTVFVFAEVVLRLYVRAWPFAPEPVVLPHLTEKDQTLKWRYTSKDGRNHLGLRNREVGPKAPDVFRILFLGDSLVFYGETQSGALYTQVLEENLNRVSQRPVEVVNAGVPGYTTYQELEFLKIYGLDMEPDLVILGFVFNDLHYRYEHRPKLDNVSPDPAIRRHHFDPHSLFGRLFFRSYSVQGGAALLDRHGHWWEDTPYCALAWKPWGWEHSEKLLGEMSALLHSRGIPLRLVVFPIRDQMDEGYRAADLDYLLYPQRHIEAICANLQLPCFDLTEALHRSGGTQFFRDHLHLNGDGNAIVAELLTKSLAGIGALHVAHGHPPDSVTDAPMSPR
jgi:lysophospholipase L1-like esterase